MASAMALACPEIRLDTQGALASYPVFDQANASADRDMNICYAATAAHLIDTFRASQAKEEVRSSITSPWWVAVKYSSNFKSDENSDVQFGEPDKALEAIKKEGMCSQEDLFGDKPTEEIIRFHSMLKEFYTSTMKSADVTEPAAPKLESLLQKMEFIKDPTALAQISMNALKEKTFVRFLRTLFQGKCQGKIKTDSSYMVERIDTERKETPIEQKDEVILQTLQKAQPIEVSLCSQVLRTLDYDGSKSNRPGKFKRNCMRHSMLVVGSRTHNGQCQYLVRDTYGSQSCTRKRNGAPWYHSSFECEGGQIWVPKENLLRNIWGMTRISPEATASIPAAAVIPAASAAN